MKNYLDLIPISAKIHKRQSRMSVVCIVLAVFLVATIFGMADMFIRSQIMQAQQDGGNFHIALRSITDEDVFLLAKRPGIKAVARYGVLNYRGEDGYTLSGKNVVLAGCDQAWVTEMLVDNIVEGNFPQTESEAMITESAKDRFGFQIGDTITINGPQGEELRYTISGFCQNASKTMREDSYGIYLTTDAFRAVYSAKKEENLEDYDSVCYVQFENPFHARREIASLKEDWGFSDEQISENTKLMGLYGQSENSQMLYIYTVAAILFVFVLLAGIMMIAGSLNSNVAQKTEFFGLMRCIGATPKQIMRMVQREALYWCRFSIPVGIGMGVILIWILCAVLRVLSPDYFAQMPVLALSIPSIFAGIAVGLLTVLLAARSPAKKAAKVSPLAAVSGSCGIYQPAQKAANTRFFKVDAALGIHHAKASKKNLILMAGSFAFSIILFLSFSVMVELMNHSLTPLRPWTPDLSIISPDSSCSINRSLLKKLQDNPAVKSVYGRMYAYDVTVTVNGKQKKADLVSYEQNQFKWSEEYLLDGSTDAIQNEAATGLIVYELENIIRVNDTVSLKIDDTTQEMKIAGMVSSCPFSNRKDVEVIICSENTFRKLTGESDYTVIDIQLTNTATDKDVTVIQETAGNTYTFSDQRMSNSSVMGTYYCFWLFVYGFLVLIGLITVCNIINSISMSVSSRTKQYGTFRAIGLSIKQLGKMIVAETCTYTMIGSIVGTILGVFCNKIFFEMLITSQWGTSWAVPWLQLGIILLIVTGAVILAVWGPVQKMRKLSIVDTIGEP